MGKRPWERKWLACWNEIKNPNQGPLEHITLLQTHFLCFHTNTAPNCFMSYSLNTSGPPRVKIHSNTSCHWSVYCVPDTEQTKFYVLSVIHTASFQGRHECPHWKRTRLGAPGWLSRLSVRLRLRSWSRSSWVQAPCRALCWQLRAWSLFQILCLRLSLWPSSIHALSLSV